MVFRRLGMALAVALLAVSAAPAEESLDYEAFKSRVEPLFLKKRPGHARCYVCHVEGNNAFRLERLAPGRTSWTDEQSRRNFQVVSGLVVPGDPTRSRLLLYPLAPEAGGSAFHSGGRQFSSQDDADWDILAQWARGQRR